MCSTQLPMASLCTVSLPQGLFLTPKFPFCGIGAYDMSPEPTYSGVLPHLRGFTYVHLENDCIWTVCGQTGHQQLGLHSAYSVLLNLPYVIFIVADRNQGYQRLSVDRTLTNPTCQNNSVYFYCNFGRGELLVSPCNIVLIPCLPARGHPSCKHYFVLGCLTLG